MARSSEGSGQAADDCTPDPCCRGTSRYSRAGLQLTNFDLSLEKDLPTLDCQARCKITSSESLQIRGALRIPEVDGDSNPYDPESDLPGALGKGQAVATALGNFFKFWAYASTVIGAIIAGNIYLYQDISQQTDIPRPISRQVQGYPVCMRCLHRRPHHSRLNINSCSLHKWRWSWGINRRHGHYWPWYRRHQGQCYPSLRGAVYQFPSRIEDAQVWRGSDC